MLAAAFLSPVPNDDRQLGQQQDGEDSQSNATARNIQSQYQRFPTPKVDGQCWSNPGHWLDVINVKDADHEKYTKTQYKCRTCQHPVDGGEQLELRGEVETLRQDVFLADGCLQDIV